MRWTLASLGLAACAFDDEGDGDTTIATTETASSDTTTAGGETTDPRGTDEETGVLTGAPAPDHACESLGECRLHSDCCSCTALHVDELPDSCDAECNRTMCQQWGITQMLCSHTCLIELVDCDAAMVTCADAPPACDDGFVPSVDERCWSGHCVPDALCRP